MIFHHLSDFLPTVNTVETISSEQPLSYKWLHLGEKRADVGTCWFSSSKKKKLKRQLLRVSKRRSAVFAAGCAVWKDTLHFLNHWSVECVPRKGKLTTFVRNLFMCLFVGGRLRLPGGFAALFLCSRSIGVSSLILNRNWIPLVFRHECRKETHSGCLTESRLFTCFPYTLPSTPKDIFIRHFDQSFFFFLFFLVFSWVNICQ